LRGQIVAEKDFIYSGSHCVSEKVSTRRWPRSEVIEAGRVMFSKLEMPMFKIGRWASWHGGPEPFPEPPISKIITESSVSTPVTGFVVHEVEPMVVANIRGISRGSIRRGRRFMHVTDDIKITAKKDEVLKILRENRERHQTILKEAREGFIKGALKELEKELAGVREGKVRAINVHMSPPQDYTRAYNTAIRAYELDTATEITLNGRQIMRLINDDWEWQEQFLTLAAQNCSGTAMRYSRDKGYDIDNYDEDD
jgi:hypothetical protein